MNFNEYQQSAKIGTYPKDFSYRHYLPLINAVLSISSIAERHKKVMRGDVFATAAFHITDFYGLQLNSDKTDLANLMQAATSLEKLTKPVKSDLTEREILTTVIFPELGLIGEVGELLKAVHNQDAKKVTKELGDVLWSLSEIASVFGVKLDEVAQANIQKLKSREEQDKIQGSGDDREEEK